MKKKIYLLALVLVVKLSLVSGLHAQSVGINRINPTAALEIVSTDNTSSTKAIRIRNSSNAEILTLTSDGKLGVNTPIPKVGLDLRGTQFVPIIGTGTTTLSAKDLGGVGAGTLRYWPSQERLQFSDGTGWATVQDARAATFVVAYNSNKEIIIKPKEFITIGDWPDKRDSNNLFDSGTGVFTAPYDGLYVASFTVCITIDDVQAGARVEAYWKHTLGSAGSSNYALRSMSSLFSSDGQTNIGILCTGSLWLKKGDTLAPVIWHNLKNNTTGLDRNAALRVRLPGETSTSSEGFNYVSIVWIE